MLEFKALIRGLKLCVYWPLMKKMMKKLVKECDIYNQAKIKRVAYPQLLKPLPNLVEFGETLQWILWKKF